MSEQQEDPKITAMNEIIHSGDYIYVEFELESVNPFKFKFLGIIDGEGLTHKEADQKFYPIVIGEVITLVDGVFPLWSHMDTLYEAGHKYIFEKNNGIILEGILDGFTWYCTGMNMNTEGAKVISVYLKKN